MGKTGVGVALGKTVGDTATRGEILTEPETDAPATSAGTEVLFSSNLVAC